MSAIKRLEWTQDLVNEFWNNMDRLGLDGMSFGRLAKRSVHWIIAPHLHQDGHHLDFGAGTGELAAHLISKGYPFAIDDPAGERVVLGQKYLPDGAVFLPFDPNAQGQFDVVTCFEVIEHVLEDQLDGFVETLAGHVRPGGTLILTAPNKENLDNDTAYCPISKVAFHRWQHVRSIDLDWVDEKFSKYGFSKIVGHQLDFSDGLYEPFLDHLGFGNVANPEPIMPLHIHQIKNDIDAVIGGATRLLYIARKADE